MYQLHHLRYELEVSNFFDQLISDRAQNLGNIIIRLEESFGEVWEKSNHKNYAMHIHSMYGMNFVQIEVSHFFDQLSSDRAQNLGNNILWREESFGEFWVKSKNYNYAILPPLHARYKLHLNLKCPIFSIN